MRLINADTLLDVVMSSTLLSDMFKLVFKKLVVGEPTVDAISIVHGEWIEPDDFELGFWQCSHCHYLSEFSIANRMYNYCPNCGAKMIDD